jgi:benzodiazapine receptor
MNSTSWLGLIGFFVAAFAAASTGAMFKPGAWYEALAKPSWQPANWVFPVVWSVLYCLIAVSGWLAWRAAGWSPALKIYAVQLVLNAAWTVIFFGLHRIGFAMVDLAVLWCLILVTVVMFYRIEPLAAWLLVPYLAWVTVAACLNFSIWRLNAAPVG